MNDHNDQSQDAGEPPIAVIGMSGRFPGADGVDEFWQNLEAGVESFATFSDEELRAAGVDEALLQDPNYVRSRPVLGDVRSFDATFFGLSPREATYTDPQQRLFTECAWESLESAGYAADGDRGPVAIYAGTNMSTYLFTRPRALRLGGGDADELMAGNDKDSLATRVSYRLDLRGPSVAVQSFCSTSLVSVHLACASLRRGECDIALAGGVSIRLPDRVGYLYQEGNQASPDGHVRTFDAEARGSMFGDGVAVVTLKRLDQAIADRDTVLAVVRGSAINNDGGVKFSYQAPSIDGQRRCVADALANAGVDSGDLSYVEAHGTATEVGDPMEVAALTSAFGPTEKAQRCLLGSVKPNVGHLDRASGVTGLIKVIQSLRHEMIPGTLNFASPNPEIDFDNSPFRVTAKPTSWNHDPTRPRIAGISSLGMGGTNCHAVVTEAPVPKDRGKQPSRWQVLPVSARWSDGADRACENLTARLREDPALDLGDVAYTLQVGRSRFEHRRFVVADSTDSAATALESSSTRLGRLDATVGRKVGFVFAGVGEQYAGMAGDLYAHDPDFRADVDECVSALGLPSAGHLSSLFDDARQEADVDGLAAQLGRVAQPVSETDEPDELVQPAVFVVEYAVARYLMRRGVRPEIMAGYSVGEYVAACLSGVLDLTDALSLVAHRAKLIARLPRGGMLAVGIDEAGAAEVLGDLWSDVDVAIRTGSQLVVAGDDELVSAAGEMLRSAGVPCRRLTTSHAYHSRMLETAGAELTSWVADNITVRSPQIPYVSNVTGGLVTHELVSDHAYWARHMYGTVEFGSALEILLADADRALVEIGPGQSLGALMRAHASCDRDQWPLIVGTIPGPGQDGDAERSLAEAVGRLWLSGVEIDWRACHGSWQPGRIPLPTYPFDRREYWLEEEVLSLDGSQDFDPDDPTGQLSALPYLEEERLVNLPVWHQTVPRPAAKPARHLLVMSSGDAHDDLVNDLRSALCHEESTLTVVRPGAAFAIDEAAELTRVTIRPGSLDDTTAMLAKLGERGIGLDRVIHLWEADSIDAHAHPRTMSEATPTIERGLHSLVALARAAGDRGHDQWTLDVVTSGAQQAGAGDAVQPHRATLLGPCRLIPVEYPRVQTRMVDVDALDTGAQRAALVRELRAEPVDQVVAIRDRQRWIPGFDVMPADADPPARVRFREGGTYLVTGGLGGIGLAMAERIAADYNANVVLLGRTAAPSRDRWDSMLDDSSTSDEVRRRLHGLQRVAASGSGGVFTVAGDVASPEDTRYAVEAAVTEFGDLNGVLHCAGVPAVGLMQFKSANEIDTVLAPKLAGAFAIAGAVRERDLDFLVMFSSTTSATGGGAGQVEYCAANAAVDAFALSDPLPGCHVVSVGWGEWKWNGWTAGLERYDEGSREFLEQYRERFGIDFDTGWRVLQRVLSIGERYAVVSTQDFSTLVRMSRTSSIASHQETVRKMRSKLGRHPRPELATPFVAPQTDPETTIAGVWAEALGLEEVGVEDNFFDLGGNSLVGMEIVSDVRAALDVDYLPPHLLYQAPTVSALALAIRSSEQTDEAEPDESRTERQSRIELRRSSLRTRRTA